ncbi:putative ribonuclease H domain, reverse transcriptase zinc-binding domain-containing protein [Arabidopsis thaliana]
MSSLYGRVWKVQAPERVRVFLWLIVNQAIMTNSERKRRHLCNSDVCQVCRGGIESIIHVLRDCPAMSGIWDRIVPRRLQQSFFTMSLLEWLYSNLRQGIMAEGSDWSTMFAMAVWWGWKWRCSNIFGENKTCRDRVRFIKDLAAEVSLAYSRVVELRPSGLRVNKPIRWTPPMEGWYKINTDGASRGNPGLASAGGVLRNSAGAWCGGFAVNIGRCSAPLAELWGVYYGLYMAWSWKWIRRWW